MLDTESKSIKCLVQALLITGWVIFFLLYGTQVGLLVSILVIHLDDSSYAAWLIFFLPALFVIVAFLYVNWELKYAETDERIVGVWIIWGTYIVPYVVTVGLIFGKIARKLTKEDDLGVNALKSTLCITPAMLILLLQLTICPSYGKPVLSLSVFAALNIFDGIEMLETFLMQNEGHFDLEADTERSIIAFACICFLLSSFGLARNKFGANGEVKKRRVTSIVFCLLEIMFTNLPFLAIRAHIWHKYKHESAVFIAKNIVSLVIGAVEFGILMYQQRHPRQTPQENRTYSRIKM